MTNVFLMSNIISSLKETIIDWGLYGRAVMILATITAVMLAYLACKRILVPIITKIVIKTSFTWDDILLCPKVLHSICKIIPAMMLAKLLGFTFYNAPLLLATAEKLCEIYIIAILMNLLLNILDAIYRLTEASSNMRNRPLKGIHQMLQVVVICIGIILIVSSLFNKSPLELLVGLSAAATVLMLVFKDSIVGLVAGVQLSANDMLRPGDWIVLPGTDVDGVVFEVGLTTVKVRNWDNTISTVPPYTLVSETYVNWRGMEEGDGRRAKRSINIDMMGIRFCSEEEIKRYENEGLIAESDNMNQMTNSTIFRRHLTKYLKKHPGVNKEMTLMVRQLQSNDEGLPIELYFFTKDKSWNNHEELMGEIVDFAIATAPSFGLKVYQRPSAPLSGKA